MKPEILMHWNLAFTLSFREWIQSREATPSRGSWNLFKVAGVDMRVCMCVLSHSVMSLCNCSPPGSSVHGILQARILEWVAVPFFRGSSQTRDQTRDSYISCNGQWVLLPLGPPGKPINCSKGWEVTTGLCELALCALYIWGRWQSRRSAAGTTGLP